MYLTIIIVNFNTYNYLSDCIESIKNKLINLDYEIVIVDNNSTETESANLKLSFPGINLLKLNNSVGFSKANNIGASCSNSKYLCFLNPDTLFVEDCITPILNFMDKSVKAGACSPMLVYHDYQYQNSTGFKMGFWFEFMESLFLVGLYRRFLNYKYNKKIDITDAFDVGWVSAACMLISKSVFYEVGGFTEYFMYNYEDIELCKKLQDKDFVNYYFPCKKIIHYTHGSFNKNYELLVFSRYQSRLIYSGLHYSQLTAILVRIINVIGLLFRIILTPLLYKGSERYQRMKGYIKSFKLYIGYV